MKGADENNLGMIGPANLQGGGIHDGGGKDVGVIRQNRRALSDINNRNIIGLPPNYPNEINRRGLSHGHLVTDKDGAIPVRRPITRRFAAQLTKIQQQIAPEKTNESVKLVPTPNGSENSDAVEVKESNATNSETAVPPDEIEMEDADEQQPVVDIDSSDKMNPLAVVEYIEDLYAYYRKAESSACVPADYMAHQSDINEKMRSILIDWLIEVHYKFELMSETLFLTVNLIDRFLAVQPIIRKKLQLVGVTAMLLACKYEEVSVPIVEDFILITDKAYSRKEVLDMEKLMVNILQFNMSVPTAYVFMRRFLKAAQSNKELEQLSFFTIELCLVEYEMLKFRPSMLAAAAIFTAQCALDGTKQWSKTSERHTNYLGEELLECSRMMVTFHQKAGTGKLTGVYRKYCTSKLGYAARSEPANFLLGD